MPGHQDPLLIDSQQQQWLRWYWSFNNVTLVAKAENKYLTTRREHSRYFKLWKGLAIINLHMENHVINIHRTRWQMSMAYRIECSQLRTICVPFCHWNSNFSKLPLFEASVVPIASGVCYRDCQSGRRILWHCTSSLWCWWHAANLDTRLDMGI